MLVGAFNQENSLVEAFSGHRELREGSLRALVLTCWPLLARPRTAGGRCLDHQCQHRLSSCWQVVPGTTVPPARLYIYIISTYPHIYTSTPWSIRGPVWVLQTIQGSDHQAPSNVGLCAWFTWLSSVPTSSLFNVYLHTVMHAWVNIGLTKLSLSYQEDTPYTWKWRKTKTLLNCSRVFSSSIHCELSKSTLNIKYGPI